MILIAFGSNLSHPRHGPSQRVIEAAMGRLAEARVEIVRRSPFYETAPVPASDQADFVNAVAAVRTARKPAPLLALLHRIEAAFGRIRGARNEARVLDLDLLAWNDTVSAVDPILPHPRLHLRAFVLLPLRDAAPGWRHPVLGRTVEEMITALPAKAVAGVRLLSGVGG